MKKPRVIDQAEEVSDIVKKTLRDEFAMAALAHATNYYNVAGWSLEPKLAAQRAFAYADAMMEAREAKS